jgi:DNA (cytosine-5)-methyltransferase 1
MTEHGLTEYELRVGSLFTGIGGFDLGFERAGMQVAWQAEVDDKASAVLAGHWPRVPNLGDVTTITPTSPPPPVDILCGGFPCQDISLANSKHKDRKGLSGDRSGLWYEYARIIDELGPRWVVIENVPGLLSSNRGADMATVVGTLADLGYGVGWRVLDSRYFGVPQRRRRVFIVGCLGDRGGGWEVLSESEGRGGSAGPGDTADSHYRPWAAIGFDSRRRKVTARYELADTLTGENRAAVVMAGGQGARCLTPLECERLQGFPDHWTDNGQADTHRYRQLGNAVTVNVAEWIGRRIVAVERNHRR